MRALFCRGGIVFLLVVSLSILFFSQALAHDDADYEDLVEMFGSWTRADVEAAGYIVQEVCVDAALEGLDPALGGMGFHAIHPEHMKDGVAHSSKPDIVLLDGEGKVVGVEYEIHSVVEEPPTVAGEPLLYTPPHAGMEHEHMSLHIYFVGDEANRFGTWNPAVSCPESASSHHHSSQSSQASAPQALPETGETESGEAFSPLAVLLFFLLMMGVGLAHRRFHRPVGR